MSVSAVNEVKRYQGNIRTTANASSVTVNDPVPSRSVFGRCNEDAINSAFQVERTRPPGSSEQASANHLSLPATTDEGGSAYGASLS